jgi:hypothetical protein
VTASAAALKSVVRVAGGIDGGGDGFEDPSGRVFCRDDRSML